MFGTIKLYISMFIGAVALGFLAYVKYLRSSNEEQKENIGRLKREIKVRKEVAKDEVKKQVFDAKQKVRAKVIKENEITLDEIEEEAKNGKDIDTEHSANDDFVSVRV